MDLSPQQDEVIRRRDPTFKRGFSESLVPYDGTYEPKNAWIWGAATFSSVVGIESPLEIFGALFAHWLIITVGDYLDFGNKGFGRGPSVMYMFLSGVRTQKIFGKGGGKQWKYVIIPYLATVYDYFDKDNINPFNIWEHLVADLLGGAFVLLKIL